MLFFITVLAYFLAYAFAEDSEPLPKHALAATKTAHLLFHDRMDKGWRDDLSEKALQYLKSPDSVKADLITSDKQSFKKTDPKPLWNRVFSMVSNLLDQKKEEVLPPILYGCNGMITKGEAEDVLSVACLYTFQ
nr:unnamed protein product [Haemonchus contortus]